MIVKRKLNPYLPVKLEDVYDKNGKLPLKAVYVGENYICSVSDGYTLVPNEDAVNLVKASLNELNIGYSDYTEYFNGRVFNKVIEIKDKPLNIGNNEIINPCIHIFNSYDCTLAFSIAIAASRVLCTNFLFIENPKVIKNIHYYKRFSSEKLYSNDFISEISNTILENMNRFDSQKVSWIKMKDFDVNKDNFYKIMTLIDIPNAYIEKVKSLIERLYKCNQKVNLWRIYNAFSYILTSPKCINDLPTAGYMNAALRPNIGKANEYLKKVNNAFLNMVN